MARLSQIEGRAYVTNAEIEDILCEAGGITGVASVTKEIAPWCAATIIWQRCPIERDAPLMSDRLLAATPKLANLRALAANVEWMNGFSFICAATYR